MRDADWAAWAARWDHFQECYVPHRETQIALMLDYVGEWRPARPVRVLDLCSGPGTLARRLLRRRPDAQVTAVDADAWLLELGRRTTPGVRAWVEVDLRAADWTAGLPRGLDAVLSMTALHWIADDTVARVYADVADLLAPDGLLLNADLIPAGSAGSPLGALGRTRLFRWQAARTAAPGGVDWHAFWAAARREPAFEDLLERRDRRVGPRRPVVAMAVDGHLAALAAAGFRDVAELWRWDAAAVLAAVR